MMVLFEGGFESGHVDLLEAASKQVGLALSNAQRYRQVNRRLAEQSALQQVARVINRRLEMEPLLEEIVNQVRQVLGYEIVEIYLVEEGNLVLRSATGGIEGEHFSLPLTEGVVGRVARTQKAAFVAEVRDDSDYVDGNPETCVEVAVPIMKGSIVIGVLNVESSLPSGLDEEDVDLLLLLADQVSVAIENASLYDRLQRHTDTLEQLVKDRTAALEGALDQARVAERLKTQFVADVSHELRTPLANIQLYLELLSFGNPERFSNYLETLMRETGRLAVLIEDLLAISRLDAGTDHLDQTPHDINKLTIGLVEDRKRMLAEKSLQVILELADDLPQVLVDERLLTQAIAALITNAMQYTRPSGRITLRSCAQDWEGQSWVTLIVSDTGIGIPPDEQARLFERFYRGSASRIMSVPGTGLGLAIAGEIMERHGGRISVESQVDQGSHFTLWLPRQDGA
jgi:signal transduction histidine kinase